MSLELLDPAPTHSHRPSAAGPAPCPHFVDALRRNALEQPDALAFRFWHMEDGQDEDLSHAQLAEWVGRYAAQLASLPAPHPLVLVLPQGRAFVAAFYACLASSRVVVPTFPPRNAVQAQRLRLVLQDLGPSYVLAPRDTLDQELAPLRHDPELSGTHWLDAADLERGSAAKLDAWHPEPTALAMLQYTSGSTGRPKGVMLNQRNMVENSQLIQDCFGHVKGQSRSVIWLPPYHDMGLVGGILQPVHAGFSSLLMPTSTLVRSPLRWLQAVSEFGGTSSGGPNFAFQLCVNNIRDRDLSHLDLSRWNIAFCGAEPISQRTLLDFSARFEAAGFRPEAMYPCYGMAETTLMVSGKPLGTAMEFKTLNAQSLARGQVTASHAGSERSQVVVSCGRVHKSLEARIVDPSTRSTLGAGEIGEVFIRGSSVTMGYWQDEDKTRQVFKQSVDGQGGYLRTGDMGFMDHGELYITGRLKEVLIVRGANFYPQDLEQEALRACPEFINCRAVAFQVPEGEAEQLCLALEVPRTAIEHHAVARRINSNLTERFGIRVALMLFVPRKTIRTTSSGKLQRLTLKDDFLSGVLPIYERCKDLEASEHPRTDAAPVPLDLSDEDALVGWMLARIAQMTKSPSQRLNADDSFTELALDSISALELLNELDSVHHLMLPPDAFYRHPSPRLLAREIHRLTGAHPAAN